MDVTIVKSILNGGRARALSKRTGCTVTSSSSILKERVFIFLKKAPYYNIYFLNVHS
jgi:hypothetical protein